MLRLAVEVWGGEAGREGRRKEQRKKKRRTWSIRPRQILCRVV